MWATLRMGSDTNWGSEWPSGRVGTSAAPVNNSSVTSNNRSGKDGRDIVGGPLPPARHPRANRRWRSASRSEMVAN